MTHFQHASFVGLSFLF